MSIALAIVSALLGVFGVFAAVVTPVGAFWGTRAKVLRGQPGHVSATPIVGTITATIAVLVAPAATFTERLRWCWVPLAVEVVVYCVLTALWYARGLHASAVRLRDQGVRVEGMQSSDDLE